MLSNARHRSKTKNLPFDLVIEDLEPLLKPNCPILGIPMRPSRGKQGPSDNSPSLDRIVPEEGYVRGNVVIISGRANRIKSDATLDELIRLARYYMER